MFNFIKRLVGVHHAQLLCSGKTLNLDKKEYLIGRASDEKEEALISGSGDDESIVIVVGNKIIIRSFLNSISRNQGQLKWNGSTYEYRNLASKNKGQIRTNKNTISLNSHSVPLNNGDKIILPGLVLEFVK